MPGDSPQVQLGSVQQGVLHEPECLGQGAGRRLFYTFTPETAPALAAYRVRLWELPAFVGTGALLGALSALCVATNVNLIYSARQRWIPPTSRFRLVWNAHCHSGLAQQCRAAAVPGREGRTRARRRLAEVVFLAAATACVWLLLSYASPCEPMPPESRQAALSPAPIPSSLYFFGEYSLFPQLWCPPGKYSVYGQVQALSFLALSAT